MTIAEMHTKFRIGYDKIDSFSAPEYVPEAIDVILNEAQDDFINDITNLGIESNQTYTDYLANLVTSVTISTFSIGTKPNGVFVNLPTDYRKAILEEVSLTYLNCNNQSTSIRIPVKPETRDRYSRVIANPFKDPSKEYIIRLEYKKATSTGSQIYELISSTGNTISDYYLDYLKNPIKMQYGTAYAPSSPGFNANVDCELSIEAQNKIVEKAIVKALKIIGDQKQQEFKKEELFNTVKTD
jgi:hypothetical protein